MPPPRDKAAHSEPASTKRDSRRITIFEPDQADVEKAITGRDLSPGLAEFLENLLRRKKWIRKIHIPSGHDDVAAVLLFTTTLKEGGLEISSELHIYFAGKRMIEKWEVAGEWEQIRSLPKESFQAIDITKVRVIGDVVSVEFTAPSARGQSGLYVTTFDFLGDESDMRTVPHPLLRESR